MKLTSALPRVALALVLVPAAGLHAAQYDLATSATNDISHSERRFERFSLLSRYDGGDGFTLGYADSGIAGVAASAGAGVNETRNFTSSAAASFLDHVTINGPGLQGTTGQVRIALRYTFREADNTPATYEPASVAGQWSAVFGSSGSASDTFAFGGRYHDPSGGVDVLTCSFTFGQSFTASLAASVTAGASGPGYFASAGQAIGFAGIVSVTDADGNAIPFAYPPANGAADAVATATIQSESGIDYTQAYDLPPISVVPEPTTLAAATLLAPLTRRRRLSSPLLKSMTDASHGVTVTPIDRRPTPCRASHTPVAHRVLLAASAVFGVSFTASVALATYADAGFTLYGPDFSTLLSGSVSATEPSVPRTLTVHDSLMLQPGRYTLQINTRAQSQLFQAGTSGYRSAFDLSFSIGAAAFRSDARLDVEARQVAGTQDEILSEASEAVPYQQSLTASRAASGSASTATGDVFVRFDAPGKLHLSGAYSAESADGPGAPTYNFGYSGLYYPGSFDVTEPTLLAVDGTMAASGRGSTQSYPVLPVYTSVPTPALPPVSHFENVDMHSFVDPVAAYGFHFEGEPGTFAAIDEMPIGFGSKLEVSAEGVKLGTYGPGDAVDSVARLGHAVGAFDVRGINPLVDDASATAFPIRLGFAADTASFTMSAIYRPDASRDGAVNFDDLLALARHYGQPTDAYWGQGDFTGDGAVTFEDLLLLARNYGVSPSAPIAPAQFAADWTLAQSLVPEPATLTAATLLAPLARRRRG